MLKNYFKTALIYLAAFSVLRLLFFLVLKDGAYPAAEISKAFFVGARLDMTIISALVLFPFTALAFTSVFIGEKWSGKILSIYLYILNAAIIVLFFLEIPFYKEYSLRLNHLLFEYLGNPKELIATISGIIPIMPLIAGLVISVAAVVYASRKFLPTAKIFGEGNPAKTKKLYIAAAMFAISLIAVRGGFQMRPLNWGSAFFSSHNFINQTGLNGVSNLFHSVRYYIQEKRQNITYTQYGDDKTAKREIIGQGETPSAKLFGKLPEKPNIIVVFMESFDPANISSMGGNKSLAPNFDRLAKQGILFTNAYANATRTSRSLTAGLCSFPPLPGVNLSKKIEAQQKVPNIARYLSQNGYSTAFFYAGDDGFEGMRAFFSNGGFQKFYDFKDFGKTECPFGIGVFDHEMFRAGANILEKEKTPFLAVFMTLTHHEPFALPSFFERDKSLTEEENVFKYSDWALGDFIANMEKNPYFKNTVFIITADHTRYPRDISAKRFRIPLLIYSPMIKQGRKIEALVSHMNIPAGVLEMAGAPVKYKDTGFFTGGFGSSKSVYFSEGPYFGALNGSFFYRESLDGKAYLFNRDMSVADNAEIFKELRTFARANLQTGRNLFIHSKVDTRWKQE